MSDVIVVVNEPVVQVRVDVEQGESLNSFIVPVQDSIDNDLMRDVIGNKTDTVAGNSLISKAIQQSAAIANLDGDLAALQGTVNGIPGDVAAVQSSVDGIAGDTSTLKADTATIKGNETTILSDLGTMKTELDTINGKVDGISTSVGNVYGDTETILSNLALTDSKVQDVKNDQAVPAQNAVGNSYIRDVVGNKTDTGAGTSLVSKLIALAAAIAVIDGNVISTLNETGTIETKVDTAITDIQVVDGKVDTVISNQAGQASATNLASVKSELDTVAANIVTLLADLAVPAQNAAGNVLERDVVGNKTDTVAGNSLYSEALKILAALAFPAQNTANNATPADVIGNKTDTTAGTSLFSKILTAIADDAIPSADSAANTLIRDVVGNKSDTHAGNSLAGTADMWRDHTHGTMQCYPRLAGAITLTKASGAWAAYPTPTEIIPANAIATAFDIHGCSLAGTSANGEYILALYKGAPGSEVLIGEVPFTRSTTTSVEGNIAIMTAIQAANTRISAAISGGNSGTNTVILKLQYHLYP